MKVYTVQNKNFLSNLDKEGFIEYTSDRDFDWFDSRYEWMNTQYTLRTGLPADRDLVWVFNKYEPVSDAHIWHNAESLCIYTFEVPMEFFKKNFLWSCHDTWHLHLNEVEGWEEEFSLFDVDPKAKRGWIQGVTSRLNISWLKSVKPVI